MKLFDRIFKHKREDKSEKTYDASILMLQDYHCCESIFRHQYFSLPRFTAESPATMGFLIDFVLPQCKGKIQDATFMSLDMTSDNPTISQYNNATDIENLQINKMGIFAVNEGERQTNIGWNGTLLVRFNDEAPTKEVLFHLRGAGGYFFNCLYTRVSVMIPHRGGTDDLRSGVPGGEESLSGENSLPTQFSFLIIEEHQDNKKLLLEHDAIEKEVKRKLDGSQELSVLEQSVYRGFREFKPLAVYIGYGHRLIEQQRWFDAYRQFIRVYHVVQHTIHSKSEEQEWFYSLAYDIGKCLNKLRRYDEAAYFLELATVKIESAKEDLEYAYIKLGDVRVSNKAIPELAEQRIKSQVLTDKPYDSNTLTLGATLSDIFRAIPGSLISIAFKKDDSDQVTFVHTKDEVWNMPLSVLAVDGMTAVVMHSNSCYDTGDAIDKSTLCAYSAFVIRVNKADSDIANGLFRINIMLPAYNYDPDKLYLRPENVPEGISFILGGDVITHAGIVDYTSSIFKCCNELVNCGRLLESGHYAKYIFNKMISQWEDLNNEKKDEFFDAAFQIGYSLMELRQMQKAQYYLEIAAQSRYEHYLKEYVNCLCNSYDPRTIAVLDSLINMEIADEDTNGDIIHSWASFLKRRKVYILIEGQKFNEAIPLLMELLSDTDPINIEYAKGELAYINERR